MYQCGGPAATVMYGLILGSGATQGFQQTQKYISTAKISLTMREKMQPQQSCKKKEPYTG